MNLTQWATLYIVMAFLAANIPWFSHRRYLIGPSAPAKTLPWYLGEWLAAYVIMGLVGMVLERILLGSNHGQGWEFYVIALCMFAVFAIPGFLWRFNIVPILHRS
ncbi:MAG: DUF2818 family protein [Acidithiobacillus sp.]|nr:DUF2818 family protein [Acidithiobacillus sp.]